MQTFTDMTKQSANGVVTKAFDDFDFQYMDYIVEHKKNVMKAFNKILPYLGGFNVDARLLRLSVLEHDISKFSRYEFDGYCDKWTRKLTDDVTVANFDKAWVHHYCNNNHHPEFANTFNRTQYDMLMPDIDTIHMCLDWHAMSIKFGGSSIDYFENKSTELATEFPWLVEKFTLIRLVLKYLNS